MQNNTSAFASSPQNSTLAFASSLPNYTSAFASSPSIFQFSAPLTFSQVATRETGEATLQRRTVLSTKTCDEQTLSDAMKRVEQCEASKDWRAVAAALITKAEIWQRIEPGGEPVITAYKEAAEKYAQAGSPCDAVSTYKLVADLYAQQKRPTNAAETWLRIAELESSPALVVSALCAAAGQQKESRQTLMRALDTAIRAGLYTGAIGVLGKLEDSPGRRLAICLCRLLSEEDKQQAGLATLCEILLQYSRNLMHESAFITQLLVAYQSGSAETLTKLQQTATSTDPLKETLSLLVVRLRERVVAEKDGTRVALPEVPPLTGGEPNARADTLEELRAKRQAIVVEEVYHRVNATIASGGRFIPLDDLFVDAHIKQEIEATGKFRFVGDRLALVGDDVV